MQCSKSDCGTETVTSRIDVSGSPRSSAIVLDARVDLDTQGRNPLNLVYNSHMKIRPVGFNA